MPGPINTSTPVASPKPGGLTPQQSTSSLAPGGGAPATMQEALAAPMPPEAELNSQFEAFMDQKLFKNEAKEKMRMLPAAAKWSVTPHAVGAVCVSFE
jgi:hypothetical protein